MAFKLTTRNKLRVTVKGTLPGENGKADKFEFTLLCHRLKQSEIDAALEDKSASTNDFLQRVVFGWEEVLDEEGEAIPFHIDSLNDCILEQPGMRNVCFVAYLKEAGATAKN